MRCAICDKDLSEKEIQWNEDMRGYEPCAFCLEIAMDAAYCDGFTTEDDEFIIIDDDTFDAGKYGDASDIPMFYEDDEYG